MAQQQQPRQPPPSTADPYANNPDAGKVQFPLAAPAGKDSGAISAAPPGAVNQGPLDPAKYKYGPAYDPPPNSKIWNPVMIKMMKGEKVTGGTVFSTDTPETYGAMANAGYDFIWTEMQHNARDWDAVGRMWRGCPHAKAVPGGVAYTDEREIQHAMDLGALVIVVPTVRSVEEGKAARNWTMFPPLGKRSLGGGQAFDPDFWGSVPGGYRNTIKITCPGRDDRNARWRVGRPRNCGHSRRHGYFCRQRRPGEFFRLPARPDYERLINIVHDAAIGAGKRLCGPFAWRDRPDFTSFQNGK